MLLLLKEFDVVEYQNDVTKQKVILTQNIVSSEEPAKIQEEMKQTDNISQSLISM